MIENTNKSIDTIMKLSELGEEELIKTVKELMQFFNAKNKECIECGLSRRRYETAEKLAPDGLCWSCLRERNVSIEFSLAHCERL